MPPVVTFHNRGAAFFGYSYPGASVQLVGFVSWNDVRDADPEATPPEIRLRTGETLAVSAVLKKKLSVALTAAGIPTVHRTDVWALLLEPFLDTEFDGDHSRNTIARLRDCGVSETETKHVRAEMREPMLQYNALHWDWVHLGLFDLLDACLPPLAQRWLPSNWRQFKRLYWRAMEIADRGRTSA